MGIEWSERGWQDQSECPEGLKDAVETICKVGSAGYSRRNNTPAIGNWRDNLEVAQTPLGTLWGRVAGMTIKE